jgi:hypothetical protein
MQIHNDEWDCGTPLAANAEGYIIVCLYNNIPIRPTLTYHGPNQKQKITPTHT